MASSDNPAATGFASAALIAPGKDCNSDRHMVGHGGDFKPNGHGGIWDETPLREVVFYLKYNTLQRMLRANAGGAPHVAGTWCMNGKD